MLGAIIGDIVGSVYEFHNTKNCNFHLLTNRSTFTDDTVMTLAVAKWLTEDESHSHEYLIKCMKELGLRHPNRGYGGGFKRWLINPNPQPYNSWGNGSGMRVSPVGFYAHSLNEALELAKISAEVTHNHLEGIKGAQAIAAAVFLARQKKTKQEIKAFIEETFEYDLNRTIEQMRPYYEYDVSCMGSVPPAIIAYLDSHDFEDAIRQAVSIGGDSDTIGAMTGAIAQATYEMPKALAGYCYGTLTPDLRDILDAFESKVGMPTEDPFNLARFVSEQETAYDLALQEMKSGQKCSQ
jgi:ADP-ribosylglycohydrolase